MQKELKVTKLETPGKQNEQGRSDNFISNKGGDHKRRTVCALNLLKQSRLICVTESQHYCKWRLPFATPRKVLRVAMETAASQLRYSRGNSGGHFAFFPSRLAKWPPAAKSTLSVSMATAWLSRQPRFVVANLLSLITRPYQFRLTKKQRLTRNCAPAKAKSKVGNRK